MGIFEFLAEYLKRKKGEQPKDVTEELTPAPTIQSTFDRANNLAYGTAYGVRDAAVEKATGLAKGRELTEEEKANTQSLLGAVDLAGSLLSRQPAVIQGLNRYKKEAIKKGFTPFQATVKDKVIKESIDPTGEWRGGGGWSLLSKFPALKSIRQEFNNPEGVKIPVEKKRAILDTLKNYNADTYAAQQDLRKIKLEGMPEDKFDNAVGSAYGLIPPVFRVNEGTFKPLSTGRRNNMIFDTRQEVTDMALRRAAALNEGLGKITSNRVQYTIDKAKENLIKKGLRNPIKAASKEAMMPMVDYERKALDIYAKGVQKNRDIIYGSEKLDALKQEQKELMKYVKERAKALKNYKKNIEAYAKKPLSPEVGYTPDITPSPAAPLSPQASPEQVSNMIEAYTKQAGTVGGLNRELRNLNQEAIKKVDDYDQWIKNFIGDFGVPVNQKAPTPTQEAIENLSKWPTPDEVAAADRMRRFKEIEAASEKPASSITGAGTLLKPNQRAGYQKWQAAQKGMKINFKKGK